MSISPGIAGGLTAFLACWALVLSQRWHGHITHDTAHGIQKFHRAPTPRVGGLGALLGLLAASHWAACPPLPSASPKTSASGWARGGCGAAVVAAGLYAAICWRLALFGWRAPWFNRSRSLRRQA